MIIQILFYSFGGSTRKEAYRLAEELKREGNTVTCTEVFEKRKRNILSCFFTGCPGAIHRKTVKLMDTDIINNADKYIIGTPVWAGFPAPAFNSIVNLIPKSKDVDVFICSSGGEAPKSKEGTIEMIKEKGLKLLSYRDVKTLSEPAK